MQRRAFRLPVTWGTTSAAKVGAATLVLMMPLPLLVLVAVGRVELVASLILVPCAALSIWIAFRCASSFVTLEEDEIVVRGVLNTRREDRVRITGAKAGYQGVLVFVEGRRPLNIYAVQKANLSTWTKTQTRADQVVRSIHEWAEIRQSWEH